jgi:hypothetical protein
VAEAEGDAEELAAVDSLGPAEPSPLEGGPLAGDDGEAVPA